ncbi:THAP domain containing protein [Trichuris trichiura]|uniref:THAP domain containing protein n=1 Tax=Trichuris trichiura TaxID=36087 RepID=A0A077ZJB4_TRITR|nr:THAP domain containing protein [Trichuris trichiura]
MSSHSCVVKGCPKVESGGYLFAFPKQEDQRKQWLQLLQLTEEEIGSNGYVCGRHFNKKHLFRQTNGTIAIHLEAIPEPVFHSERGSNRSSTVSSSGQQPVDFLEGLDRLADSVERKRRQTTESTQSSAFKQARKDILESVLRQLLPKGSDNKQSKHGQPADQQEASANSAIDSNEPKARSSGRNRRRPAVHREKLLSQETENGELLTRSYQPNKSSKKSMATRSANLKAAKGKYHVVNGAAESSINNDTTKNNDCQECANGFRAMESHVKRLDSKLDAILALLETLKGPSAERVADSTLKSLPKRRAKIPKLKDIKTFARPSISLRRPDKQTAVEPKMREVFSPPKPVEISRSIRSTKVVKTEASSGGHAQKVDLIIYSDLDMAMGKAVLMFLGRGFSTYHLRKFGPSVLSDVSPVVLNACIEQLTNEGLLKSLGQLELRFPNVNSKTQVNLEVFKKSPPTVVVSQQLAPYGLTREAYAAAFFGRHHSKLKQINVLCDKDESSSTSA